MFGVLSDGVSEVAALREHVADLEVALATARGEADNWFYGTDARTGDVDVQFLALSLPVGSIVDVTDCDGGVSRFVRASGGGGDAWVAVGAGLCGDAHLCDAARKGKSAVVRRPGLVDKSVDGGEGEPSFAGVDGYTGMERSYRVSDLRVGAVIFLEDDTEGDIMWVRSRADGGNAWEVTDHFGDVFPCNAPSVDDLMPGSSGRLPVVYAGLG